jgi:hypothetical protein
MSPGRFVGNNTIPFTLAGTIVEWTTIMATAGAKKIYGDVSGAGIAYSV